MILDIARRILQNSLAILNDAALWLLLSFVLAGLLHSFLKPERLQRMLGNRCLSSLVRGTVSGMLLPICSCGVIPLGLGLYYSGAYLGPTLSFMTATPIINPAAVLLAFGLLGPEIATIYLVSGFVVPIAIGLLGNWLAGPELRAPGLEDFTPVAGEPEIESVPVREKILAGFHWGFMDLGIMVSKYIVLGVFLAGLILTLVPKGMIQEYLGNPGMISLAGIAALGTIMYVCAVGHIPFIAALIASGAAPGLAITFLMTGAATNLPELISIYKVIGKRAVAIYAGVMVSASMLIGYATNTLLLRDFTPLIDFERNARVIGWANQLIVAAPEPLQYACSGVIVALCAYACVPRIQRLLTGAATSP